jgi:hypothetical protein
MTVSDVTLARYQGLLWSLEVEVAGRGRRFLFDLGAGVTSLDARLGAETGRREVRRVTGTRMFGQRLEVPIVDPVELRIGGATLPPRPLGMVDMSALLPPGWPPVDGILALDALEHVPFAVDFARDRMRLGDVGDVSTLRPVDVRLHRQIPDVSLVILVAVACPGGDLWFELDNSNNGPSVVAPAAAERLGIARSDEIRDVRVDVKGLGEVTTPVRVRQIIYDGNLGKLFNDGRRLAFDLARGRVWIGPVTDAGCGTPRTSSSRAPFPRL